MRGFGVSRPWRNSPLKSAGNRLALALTGAQLARTASYEPCLQGVDALDDRQRERRANHGKRGSERRHVQGSRRDELRRLDSLLVRRDVAFTRYERSEPRG
jgi:hypothetical protein